MINSIKEALLSETKAHIDTMRQLIQSAIADREKTGSRLAKASRGLSAADALAHYTIASYNDETVEHLKQLYPSPYFTRCDFEIDGQKKPIYISKFSFSEEGVYSWTTPIATLRFEDPGNASYKRPNGTVRSGVLSRKDQYMIADGHLIFQSTEGINQPRELVYQEHFTKKNQGFMLPEVVEKMEKAQDQIIRADHRGPFTISGPAGSGKTTLALHRIAYLLQSPETAEYFTPDKILVLVQDAGTKEYFSHLLPELGIKGVEIITFFEWATAVLQLSDYSPTLTNTLTRSESQLYEYAKYQALKKLPQTNYSAQPYSLLQALYAEYFTPDQLVIFAEQKKYRTLDRFDLTILLHYYKQTNDKLFVVKEMYYQTNGGEYRKKKFKLPAYYNLMLVDEFQNYLPEQLTILKSCVNNRLESIMYIGDIAQQTLFGTVKSWGDIHQDIAPDRFITLQKVYRNTKEILEYVSSLGYPVSIPKELRTGPLVQEPVIKNESDGIKYVNNILENQPTISVGILSYNQSELSQYRQTYIHDARVHCLTIKQAQGVEFDAVCIVGVDANTFSYPDIPENILSEIKKVDKDLLYVALTRARTELHILGQQPLVNSTKTLQH